MATELEYLKRNLEAVQERIAHAAQASGRQAGDIRMIAAVKYATPEEIRELCRLGVRALGENRVQQMLEHDAIPEVHEAAEWHFIGSLQTNKVKYIIDKVTMIHSLDSLRLAEEIERQAVKHGRTVDVLVEINSGEEASKGGVLPAEAEAFCLALRTYPHLCHRGFMTMAPKCEKKDDYLKYFQQTYEQVLDIWQKKLHNIDRPILSMGMSDSFEEAIACGADTVRIGRGLFVQ